MPQRVRIIDDDDSDDFSETDISMRGGRGLRASVRRRSTSRRRDSEALLVPPMSTRVHRSASTGGRRSRDQPTVMVFNEMLQDNQQSNKPRRVQQRINDEEIFEEFGRSRRGRDVSPRPRDYDLVVGQRMLDRNDMRQDWEIWNQQKEIERLERELEGLQHAPRETRLLRDEEEYEDEISERLRRLQRLERKNGSERQRRDMEREWKIKRLEEQEREAAQESEIKAKIKEAKLKEIAKMKEEEEERERVKKELKDEEARKALEEAEKKKEELLMKKAAVEEWKLEQERKRLKEKEEADKRDKEFREKLQELGYTEEQIEDMLNKNKKPEEKEEKWIRVHRKHLMPETLMAYQLPWEWDVRDQNYIVIKKWVDEDFQDKLFSHTKRIREGKVLTQTSSSTTELRVNDRNKDKMYLVRKKSPSRKSWLLT
ncbi:hypothetical protein N7474_006796 [Penicillium riverlandense]|uniref:uncharacterized protein n=1 Tax=Penicillium riverlandense TaxID=1903569 RepID=UPI002548DA27|nr:uncharacterized protein N7474_006796 [Penicillium riverlandense]KAJ5815019.1 hypothetical protein N7474_006796 [Penicillium riverlandense]